MGEVLRIPAWLAWLFVHLMNIVAFQNRLLVLIQWAGNYLTGNRSARLITSEDRAPPPTSPSSLSDRASARMRAADDDQAMPGQPSTQVSVSGIESRLPHSHNGR